LLQDNDIAPVVIEMNLNTVRDLRAQGIAAVYGDARHRDTLAAAGIRDADSLILSAAGMSGSEQVVQQARDLNPQIRILARGTFLFDLPALRAAGADIVLSNEGEIALAFTEALLRELGATPDQIDRERDRVRSDLFGAAHQVRPNESQAAVELSAVQDASRASTPV
jgi:CPA2 family monovalent cation:H+ antiporter-2